MSIKITLKRKTTVPEMPPSPDKGGGAPSPEVPDIPEVPETPTPAPVPTKETENGKGEDGPKKDCRESWLLKAKKVIGNYSCWEVPNETEHQISVGYGKSTKTPAISYMSDGMHHTFISPEVDTTKEVVARLIHELCHVVVSLRGGSIRSHRGDFFSMAREFFEGSVMSLNLNGNGRRVLLGIIEELGPYPHKPMEGDSGGSGGAPQKGRMLKAECKESGYTVRVTRTWLDTYGPPISPVTNLPMTVEGWEPKV